MSVPEAATAAEKNPRRWLILIVLCLATLVLVVDNMVLTVAIPKLTVSLHASAQSVQWILDSYILCFAGLLLSAGSLSDRFGRRRLMVIGLSVFGVASAVATFAADPGELIAARTFMGIGGALIMPSTLSILITVFDDEERRTAMAVWSAVAMLGLVGGPMLGGLMISHFWWGSVFLLNLPIAALAIVASLTLMPESKGPWRKPDPLGAVLSVVGLTAGVWVIIELPKGFARPSTLAALVVSVAALTAFGVWETRIAEPMVPLHLFKERNFSGASLSMTLVAIGNGGLLLVVTLYLQFVLGYSPIHAAVAFVPLAVSSLVFNSLGVVLGRKLGNRFMTGAGLVILAGAFALMSTTGSHDGMGKLSVGLVLVGAGAGLGMPAAIQMLMAAVPPEQAGVSSALNDTIQQTGAALGVAVLGTVVTSRFTAGMPTTAPAAARLSIGDAYRVYQATGDHALLATARDAFTHAQSTAYLTGAVASMAAAVLAVAVLRDKKPEPVETGEAGEVGEAETTALVEA